MGLEILDQQQLVGRYFAAKESLQLPEWMDVVSIYEPVESKEARYPISGSVPRMVVTAEGIFETKQIRADEVTLTNELHRAIFEMFASEYTRDKTAQIMRRIDEMGMADPENWIEQVSAIILAGESETVYDGKALFATDHLKYDENGEIVAGGQSNILTVSIAATPYSADGSTATNPSAELMSWALLQAVARIRQVKDTFGKPLNAHANDFLGMFPSTLAGAGLTAINADNLKGGQTNVINRIPTEFRVRGVGNSYLDTWTSNFVVFNNGFDSFKPIIRQEEALIVPKFLGPGSEFTTTSDKVRFMVDSWRTAKAASWQNALLVKITA